MVKQFTYLSLNSAKQYLLQRFQLFLKILFQSDKLNKGATY